MLLEKTLFGDVNKVEISIMRLKEFEPEEGYYLAFSGGKDSICIYQLALMASVKFDAHMNFTSVDPPEVIRFVKTEYPEVSIDRPRTTMWELIENKRMPPTRIVRYCCAELKERGGEGRFVATGVRAAESAKRKHRAMVDLCYTKHKRIINPIIDWTDEDVWEFIRSNNFKYPSLYDEGWKRIGCIMCPMGSTKGMVRDMKKFPNYYKAYLLAFKKMLIKNKKDNINCRWETEQEVMDWWLSGKNEQKDKQLFETERYHYE
jgi:phosphoadenosine phosphosulfate reductase